jgi:MAP/microtubule affinity-regulating kinase
MIQREKDILKTLDHPNIVKLKEVVEDPDKEKCHMLFEYVSGGELFAYIVAHGRLKEKDARRFVRQVRRSVFRFITEKRLLYIRYHI